MKTPAHTPGPWIVWNKGKRKPGQQLVISTLHRHCELAFVPHHGKFSEANADLMAAATDLLEAGNKALNEEVFHIAVNGHRVSTERAHELLTEIYALLQPAIAKATGAA